MNALLLGYIDPGSGFILLQVVFAGVIGGLFYFRRMVGRAFRFVTGRGKGEPEAASPQVAAAAPEGEKG